MMRMNPSSCEKQRRIHLSQWVSSCPLLVTTRKKEIEDDLLEVKHFHVVIEMFCLNVGFKCTPLSTLYVVKAITLT